MLGQVNGFGGLGRHGVFLMLALMGLYVSRVSFVASIPPLLQHKSRTTKVAISISCIEQTWSL